MRAFFAANNWPAARVLPALKLSALKLSALVLSALVTSACVPANGGDRTPAIELSPCGVKWLTTQAECGTYEVWENRSAQTGRRLSLKVAVVRAVAEQPEPDPVFVLAGGPGQSATQDGGVVVRLLDDVHRDRDIVLLDQRGTGGSHPLDCNDVSDKSLSSHFLISPKLDDLRACLDHIDADPVHYVTSVAILDLDEVRAALGYGQINIWAGSYGTRVALAYAKRFGSNVRSMTLDGLAPTDLRLPLYVERDRDRALEQLFAACTADGDCAKAFGDLRGNYKALLTSLTAEPLEIRVSDPQSGEPTSFTLSEEAFTAKLHGILYDSTMTALLPFTLKQAARGRFEPFVAQSLTLSQWSTESLAEGLFLSVACAEDVDRISDLDVAAVSESQPHTAHAVQTMREACAVWPHATVPEEYYTPTVTGIPTLLLSGDLDPITPPWWGEQVATHLSNQRHVVVPGIGHGTTAHGCVPELIAEFFATAKPAALDTQCVSAMQRPPFFIGFAGPKP